MSDDNLAEYTNIQSIIPGEEFKNEKENDGQSSEQNGNGDVSDEKSREIIEDKSEDGTEVGQSDDGESEEAKSLDELPLPEEPEAKEKERTIPKWVEKKLSRKEQETQRLAHEAAVLKQQLNEMRAAAEIPVAPVSDPTMPQRGDYDDEGLYITAIVNHQNRKASLAQQKAAQEESVMHSELQFRNKLNESVAAGLDKYEDFEEKVKPLFSADFPVNRAMAEAIVDSPHRQDILYFLGQYPDKAKDIALLNPIQAVKRIAGIEARFDQHRKPTATKAPPPIEPITGGAIKPSVNSLEALSKNASTMSQRDFELAVSKMNGTRDSEWS
jgi:hypothetical protein